MALNSEIRMATEEDVILYLCPPCFFSPWFGFLNRILWKKERKCLQMNCRVFSDMVKMTKASGMECHLHHILTVSG